MEREKSKVLDTAKNIALGVGIIALAFVAADAVLLQTGLLVSS